MQLTATDGSLARAALHLNSNVSLCDGGQETRDEVLVAAHGRDNDVVLLQAQGRLCKQPVSVRLSLPTEVESGRWSLSVQDRLTPAAGGWAAARLNTLATLNPTVALFPTFEADPTAKPWPLGSAEPILGVN